jgi:hypothetical protein
MGLLKYVRDRKQVKASRAGEWSPNEWTAPKTTVDWDTPSPTPKGPSNKELMAAKDAKTAARNEANNTPMAPVTFSKPTAEYDPHKYRLMTGDD